MCLQRPDLLEQVLQILKLRFALQTTSSNKVPFKTEPAGIERPMEGEMITTNWIKTDTKEFHQ